MKKATLIVSLLLITFSAFAQPISGQWHGLLKVPGQQLTIIFNIVENGDGYTSTMDSPDQGAKGIPVSSTSYIDSILTLDIQAANIQYKGTYTGKNGFTGTFTQAGKAFPLTLSTEKPRATKNRRPQEPSEPYPYTTEDITFENTKEHITLAGTLTLPQLGDQFPVVILISGSGPQNRDEELQGHKPFLVLADHLTKKGFAVLRYDDRGVGESTGDFITATSADFAADVQAAIQYLQSRKEINKNQIGLIGHSEGGLIAPMVAAESKDVAFIVMLAGPGISGDKILMLQQELIAKATGTDDSDIKKQKEINAKICNLVIHSQDNARLKMDVQNYLTEALQEMPDEQKQDFIACHLQQLTSPWMKYFLTQQPAESLEKVKCPVLAINGEKDLQVTATVNLKAIEEALKKGKNTHFVVKKMPGLNHLFQECETGSPQEYATIEQTFSPKALNEISDWLVNQVQ
ncbi:MAG: alpha/beta hydrolase [Marinilabiliaceae bacterium]|nr:alpha/beta hydrolase [Marinilabiliaceae bacterium]